MIVFFPTILLSPLSIFVDPPVEGSPLVSPYNDVSDNSIILVIVCKRKVPSSSPHTLSCVVKQKSLV